MNAEAVTCEVDQTADVRGADLRGERGGTVVDVAWGHAPTNSKVSDDGLALGFTPERPLACMVRRERFPRAVG